VAGTAAGHVCPAGSFAPMLVTEAGPVSERLRVREIGDDEGRRLVRINRRGSGSVVTWRRAQMVLLSAHGIALFQAEAWLSLAWLFLGIALPNLHRWDRQAQRSESWLRRSKQ
jgi:hypothetical protein